MSLRRTVAAHVDRILQRLWPASIAAEVHQAYLLSVLEEHREVWEPQELTESSVAAADPPPSRRPRQAPVLNPEFDDLPTVQVLSARISDDEIDFISDMHYLRDLQNEIFTRAILSKSPIPALPEQWHGAPEITNLTDALTDFKDIA